MSFGVIQNKSYDASFWISVVVVKRTWGLEARNIEFFSDQEDHYIPTVTLGVENTERGMRIRFGQSRSHGNISVVLIGHCSKTLGILKYFVENHADTKKWLVIADDDTLLR